MTERGKNVLVGTIPRSGTNFIYYFNIFYEIFLENASLTPQNIYTEIDLRREIEDFHHGRRKRTHLNVDRFFVGHAYCPGFLEHGKSNYKEDWEKLRYDDYWWNALGKTLQANKEFFYPQLNKNACIIFLYRNPLDVMVSLFRHLRNHRHKPANTSDFGEFCRAYMPCYIKTYLSYADSHREYSENILFVKYESLVRETANVMKSIFEFIHRPVIRTQSLAFEYALRTSRPVAMKKLEVLLGKTLAGDQTLPPGQESHLRGGKIGKWQEVFSKTQISAFETLFERFGLSLSSLIST